MQLTNLTDPVELTRQMIDIPSVSGDEGPLADAVEAALRGAGFGSAPSLEILRDGDAVCARTRLGLGQRVVLAGHLDTVPIADNVPGRLEERDGATVLWGRGSVDMLGGCAAALALVNRLMAAQVSKPLIRLNESIRKLELGQDSKIYVGGSAEVRHLGRTLQSYVREIQLLMRDIVREQEEKRKSELDALQSQINPHFLYNTLDSIVWMIEGQRYDDAVVMITELASLFRISLSGGKTIISMEAELRHAENYMNIQKVRFKNSFRVRYEIDPEVRNYCTVKLILQPILENAIYYGVKGMEDEGEILLRAELRDGELLLTVRDNGFGIPEEEVPLLLREGERRPSRGSGVGLLNVQRRIQLRFGEHYGLAIESEPDEGTEVRICLPAVPYNEENRQRLEEGR